MLGHDLCMTVCVVAAVVDQVPEVMENACWTMLGHDLGMTVGVAAVVVASDQVLEMMKIAGNLLSRLWQRASE